MDAVLLFALPLVGGLIFCSRFNCTRWRAAREDGHRLYFRAVFFGAILFAIIAAVRVLSKPFLPSWLLNLEASVVAAIQPLVVMKEGTPAASITAVASLALTCFVAMLAGFPFAWLLNLVFKEDYWLRRAIKKNTFEATLLEAADREFPIMVTMDDGKVYVGYVVEGFNPGEDRKFLSVLPLMSGYRTEDTHKVTFTTFYIDAYGSEPDPKPTAKTPLPGNLGHLSAEDFRLVLPVDKLGSCRLFDAVAYRSFQKRGAPAPKPKAEKEEPPR